MLPAPRSVAWLVLAYSLLTSPSTASPEPHLQRASASLVRRVSLERAWAEARGTHGPAMQGGVPTLTSGRVSARFDEAGAEISLGAHLVGIRLAGIGRGSLGATALGAARIDGVEVGYERAPGVREWWRSLPSGLEHGVTIEQRIAGEGRLLLALAVAGVSTSQRGDGVALVTTEGAVIGRYDGLVVLDARRRRLPAALIASADGIHIEVDDGGARYPLVVDPFVGVEEAVLRAPVPSDEGLGVSVAIDATGTRLVAGASDSNLSGFGSGRAVVYVRAGTTWAEEAVLIDPESGGNEHQGRSVAMSAAGDRVVVGRLNGGTNVFVRSGTTWSVEADLGGPSTGSVALSSDGSVALIGNSFAFVGGLGFAGVVRVHRRVGSTWTLERQWAMSVPTESDLFGQAVTLSADGTVALIGCPRDDEPTNAGSAWAARFADGAWSELTELVPDAPASNDEFGSTVVLSGDGVWAAVGAPSAEEGAVVNTGVVTLFRWDGSAWVRSSSVAPTVANTGFGGALALGFDGSTMLVGTPFDDTRGTGAGAVAVYVRTGMAWAERERMHASGDWFGAEFGGSVALSQDASRVAVGAPSERSGSTYAGSVRVFADVAGACSSDAECASGHCIDGVCCDTSCGGGALDDCQACSAALTGGVDGRCATLSASVAATVTCRAPAGPCDRAEVCGSTSVVCPVDTFFSGSTTCRPARDVCDAAEVCSGASAVCPADVIRPTGSSCRPSLGVCDPAEVCDGASDACPPDARSTSVCRATQGVCDVAEVCDGVAAACPADARRGAATTCRVAAGPCDQAEVCGGGVDCPNDAFLTGVCRPSEGPCDLAESCSGASASCPADARRAGGYVCRASLGACDPLEVCDGASTACPSDLLESAGTTCRASAGGCDPAEFCSGDAAACPADARTPSDEVCRPSAGVCDSAEVCDGTSVACPGNTFEPAGTPCGGGEPGSCARANVCTGSGAECPDTMGVLPEGTVCLAAPVGSACDVDDVCDGSTSTCEARFRDASTACGPAPSGVCDAPDHCAGTSADCVETFLDGVECRPASGACDSAEFCTGSASCPPDAVLASGVSCRESSDSCDPTEVCDGVGAVCPADENHCAEPSDAGPDHDGGARDAGADAGGPIAATGCSCRVGGRTPSAAALIVSLLALAIGRRRSVARRAGR